jgi:hypothetical protein
MELGTLTINALTVKHLDGVIFTRSKFLEESY